MAQEEILIECECGTVNGPAQRYCPHCGLYVVGSSAYLGEECRACAHTICFPGIIHCREIDCSCAWPVPRSALSVRGNYR